MSFAEGSEIQLVVFKLGNEEYGVPITQVKEINRLTNTTKVPKSPEFVEGIINLRGQIIPIIDLKKRFDLELTEYTGEARIIVIQVAHHTFGVKVDAVSEVLRISTDTIENAPDIVSGIDARYITGVAKVGERLLILLDLDKLLTDEEKVELSEIHNEAV
ncbi:CheW protein [Thermincola ferriacetica]|uniref:CheW protein n=1 Tax=Thermincola ferriacetica TaxID=281456 RepID=A0A0L6W400_9FIRM|nr:chemotaxis protein CheW [Thermincola ferriacetica]KNZ69814.1 CheW protein [Thermincola ferriacetica]